MIMLKKFMRHAALLSACALLAACATTTSPGRVGVDRSQLMLVSAKDMDKSAEQAYRSTLTDAKGKGALLSSGTEVDRVRNIAKRLIPVTAVFRADAPQWKWEANVIQSQELNAWCMPGGKIAVYTGLIEKLKITDDELAAVMGHEISHALREHGRERASRAMMTNLGVNVLSAAAGLGQAGAEMAGNLANVALTLPNSREGETEADRMGVELAARAGFDPTAAIRLWQKMEQMGGGKPPEWLSTHPSGSSRIADLTVYAERVMPLYEEARRTRRPVM